MKKKNKPWYNHIPLDYKDKDFPKDKKDMPQKYVLRPDSFAIEFYLIC